MVLFKHFLVRMSGSLAKQGRLRSQVAQDVALWAYSMLAPAPLWSSSHLASFCGHSFFPGIPALQCLPVVPAKGKHSLNFLWKIYLCERN